MRKFFIYILISNILVNFFSIYGQGIETHEHNPWKGEYNNGYKNGKWEDKYGNYRIYRNDTVIECKELNNYFSDEPTWTISEHESKYSKTFDTIYAYVYSRDENNKRYLRFTHTNFDISNPKCKNTNIDFYLSERHCENLTYLNDCSCSHKTNHSYIINRYTPKGFLYEKTSYFSAIRTRQVIEYWENGIIKNETTSISFRIDDYEEFFNDSMINFLCDEGFCIPHKPYSPYGSEYIVNYTLEGKIISTEVKVQGGESLYIKREFDKAGNLIK